MECLKSFGTARLENWSGGEANSALRRASLCCLRIQRVSYGRGFRIMMLYDFIKQELVEIRKICWKVLRKVIICLYLLLVLSQFLSFHIASVRSQSSSLLVFAEASSFARLDDIDPSGWFYQAVLYNPTDSDIVVTGLRWWYNASVKLMDGWRDVRCYDSRHFSFLPDTYNPDDRTIWWEYAPGDISITIPAKEIIVTWIEVPPYSKNDDGILATYYVQAHVDGQWLSSPLYVSHSGHDNAVSTVFRADFNLTTDPNDEQQNTTQHNIQSPEWLFNEDRSVVAGLSTRVRVIPVASSRNSLGMDYANINVTLPSGWNYVPGTAYNPYDENITYYSVDGKDRLQWNLTRDVIIYSQNQSMAQNYIEFNVTAPYVPSISNFTVTSIITSLNARTTMENQYIYAVVKTPPNATFTSSSTTLLTGENVTFNATASYDLDGQIVSYFWDFGDGNTGTGNITTYSYADNGTYTVTLTVTDNDGLKDTALDTIIVQNRPPFAQFTESAEIVDTDVVIYFNASDSYDPDGSIVSYFWDFGDGTNATGAIVNHSYVDDGVYTVTLTITDDDGAIASTNATKTILNRPPIASFTESAETVYTDEVIYFNASDSYDPDGAIVSYFWDFGDGTNATGVVVEHAYAENGTYSVTLTVTDDDGASAIVTDVKTVLNRGPVASFVIVPQQPLAGETIIFNASASYDPDGEIVSYKWDFGDDNITIISSPTIVHKYASFGNYTVTLTIIDNDNFYNSSTLTLTVHNVDIAIVDMTVSTSEVYLGQTVNITVIIKNEGTINTTFKVTVYANNTAIGVQTINDLQPSQTRNLVFIWNTSGFAGNSRYMVKAVASQALGETDTLDNVLESGIVTLKSSAQPSISPFPIDFPYAIPIGLISVLFLSVGLIWRRRKSKLKFVGFRFFDEITNGGIPEASSVMITGGPSSGKSVLSQQLAFDHLENGKTCIYISYDCFPDEVRQSMKNFLWDISMHEKEGSFCFIDCYSQIAGVKSKERYSIDQPFSLSDLGIMISEAMGSVWQKSPMVVLDSTTPLFARIDSAKVLEFIQDRSARIKGENGIFLFIVGKGTLSDDHMNKLKEIVDCIIELQAIEEKGKIARRLRIKKLRGRNFVDAWIPFKIKSKSGIIFLAKKRK